MMLNPTGTIWFFTLAFALAGLSAAPAAELPPTTPARDLKGEWAFKPDPELPNVMLIGDSISIGYTLPVRKLLEKEANVFRAMKPGGKRVDNCGDTVIGLKNIDAWLGSKHWDVIHFNWGLWDLCYRNPAAKTQGNRDKEHGKISVPPDEYEQNLEQLVTRMKSTGARLIWASTTFVPDGEVGRFVGDDAKYNTIAARVMKRHGIPTNDLHTLTRDFGGRFSVAAGDVHFTAEGSREIAKQVAREISKPLARKK